MTTDWKNRIVATGEVDPASLVPNPKNYRRHPNRQLEALEGALDKIGFIAPATVNRLTGNLIDGHARAALAVRHGVQSIPVQYVELSAEEEALALATLDPITALATHDAEALESLLSSIETDNPALNALLDQLLSEGDEEGEEVEQGEGVDHKYVRTVKAPIYEIKGDKPAVGELFDDAKTQSLLAEIEAADLPDDVRRFLILAAHRHTILHFNRIAEFYAHADAPLQRLMENSALVIIDFERAIENGFVLMTERIAALGREEDEE